MYYNRASIDVPDLFKREFGFGFNHKIDYRHQAFGNANALNAFFREEAPLYASVSTAHYAFPAARPMEKKGFQGSDLVFDIDKPSSDFEHGHNPIFCTECFEHVKKDALRLKGILQVEFGLEGFSANYSGNKGFHFHLRDENLRALTQDSRRQLTEFLQGPETVFSGDEKNLLGPGKKSGGWHRRFYAYACTLIENSSLEELKHAGLRGKNAEMIFEKKALVLALMREGKWRFATPLFWKKLYDKFRAENSVVVDAQVTLDLARLIRIPNSLHGDTGFIAKTIGLEQLASFKLEDALAFGREKTIKISAQTDIEIGFPERLSLKKGEQATATQAAGIMLLCKNKALLA